MSEPDMTELRRRIGTIIRAANRLRANLEDLHTIAWEPGTAPDAVNVDHGDQTARDWTPRAGDPRARHLLDHIDDIVTRAGVELVGCERAMDAIFRPGVTESVRGTMISQADFGRLQKRQADRRAAGQYTPERIVDQPPHPGRRR